jgi:hypothetical protein
MKPATRDTVVLATGAMLGAAVAILIPRIYAQLTWKEYHVASIESHYPHEGNNSETTLVVYVSGTTGHVKTILCLFPPSLALKGTGPDWAAAVLDPADKDTSGWSGLSTIEVGPIGQEYAFGQVGYLCRAKE